MFTSVCEYDVITCMPACSRNIMCLNAVHVCMRACGHMAVHDSCSSLARC